MNTIKIKLFLLTTLAMVITGCANKNHLADDGPAPIPPIISFTKEEVKLDLDVGKRVFAFVEESPRLTEQLRTALQKKGMIVVQDRKQAEVVYRMDGAFRSIRTDLIQVSISLGKYAEHPEKLIARGQEGSPLQEHAVLRSTSWIVLERYERNSLDISAVHVGYNAPTFKGTFFRLYGRATFQSGLDALFKSVGLPEGSLQVKS